MISSPTCATTPPITEGSTTTLTSRTCAGGSRRGPAAILSRCSSSSGTARADLADRVPAALGRELHEPVDDRAELARSALPPRRSRGGSPSAGARARRGCRGSWPSCSPPAAPGPSAPRAAPCSASSALAKAYSSSSTGPTRALGLRDGEQRLARSPRPGRPCRASSVVPVAVGGRRRPRRCTRRSGAGARSGRASCSTTRPASSTAISPTWARSSWKTRSRSARISSWARDTIARASSSASDLDVAAELVGGLARLLDDPVRLLAGVRRAAPGPRRAPSASDAGALGRSPARPGSSRGARRAGC